MKKHFLVSDPHAITHPRTVVVHPNYTTVAHFTVMGIRRLIAVTFVTVAVWYKGSMITHDGKRIVTYLMQ